MIFYQNLRSETVRIFREAEKSEIKSWLLSTHRASRENVSKAIEISFFGGEILADNGTGKLISKITSKYRKESDVLNMQIKALRKRTKRTPRGKSIPYHLKKKYDIIIQSIFSDCDLILDDITIQDIVTKQIEYKASHIIAKEDFGIACLISLGIERIYSSKSLKYFTNRNLQSISYWDRTCKIFPDNFNKIYCVIAAFDYNTAYKAGLSAAAAGVEHIAIGFSAINSDSFATDFIQINKKNYKVKACPRRYSRAGQIILGITEAYKSKKKELKSFHALGLGSPVLFYLITTYLPSYCDFSADSTSPIFDATKNGYLYTLEDIFRRRSFDFLLKLKLNKTLDLSIFLELVERKVDHNYYRISPSSTNENVDDQVLKHAPFFHISEFTEYKICHNNSVLHDISMEIMNSSNKIKFCLEKIDLFKIKGGYVDKHGIRAFLQIQQKYLG
jgi:hypothetical protein